MSSTLRIITNSKGSNDRTIIAWDGEVVYDGSSMISSKNLYGFITSLGSADYDYFHEMTDVEFINWESVIYE